MKYCDGCSKGIEKDLTPHKAYYGAEYELCDTCLKAYEYMAEQDKKAK